MRTEIKILPIEKNISHQNFIKTLLHESWGSDIIISRGNLHNGLDLEGFIAVYENSFSGLVTYKIINDELEVISLNALRKNLGIGTELLNSVINTGKQQNCKRICLVTTNDNLDAMRFYMRRNFKMIKVYPGAIVESRKLKPSIPLFGNYGIPISDEIEFEMLF